jgi:hypothetical protein
MAGAKRALECAGFRPLSTTLLLQPWQRHSCGKNTVNIVATEAM